MRLVCPNCDAEYEVDPSAIPSSGRDVQCSNCGTSWFQPSPLTEAAAAEEAALFDAPPAGYAPPSYPPADTPPAPAPQTNAEPAAPAVVAADPAPAGHAPRPRGLDEQVVAVLREEAEREAAARRVEAAQTIETQTEMGLAPDPSASAANPVARRIAMLKGADPEPREPKRAQTRRDMLPAIEEINSTLRATSERRSGEPLAVGTATEPQRTTTNGFRNGFVLMLLVAVIGALAYVMAPSMAEQIPGLAPGLDSYVAAVDGARLWLDGWLQQAIATLRGLSDSPSA